MKTNIYFWLISLDFVSEKRLHDELEILLQSDKPTRLVNTVYLNGIPLSQAVKSAPLPHLFPAFTYCVWQPSKCYVWTLLKNW
jgi:hypothetical protein